MSDQSGTSRYELIPQGTYQPRMASPQEKPIISFSFRDLPWLSKVICYASLITIGISLSNLFCEIFVKPHEGIEQRFAEPSRTLLYILEEQEVPSRTLPYIIEEQEESPRKVIV